MDVGGDPTEPAEAVITICETEQRSLPPGDATSTLTYPEDVELGADITGPGISFVGIISGGDPPGLGTGDGEDD